LMILVFFCLGTVLASFSKNLANFKSSGHPVSHQFPPLSRIEIQRTCDQKQKTYE